MHVCMFLCFCSLFVSLYVTLCVLLLCLSYVCFSKCISLRLFASLSICFSASLPAWLSHLSIWYLLLFLRTLFFFCISLFVSVWFSSLVSPLCLLSFSLACSCSHRSLSLSFSLSLTLSLRCVFSVSVLLSQPLSFCFCVCLSASAYTCMSFYLCFSPSAFASVLLPLLLSFCLSFNSTQLNSKIIYCNRK